MKNLRTILLLTWMLNLHHLLVCQDSGYLWVVSAASNPSTPTDNPTGWKRWLGLRRSRNFSLPRTAKNKRKWSSMFTVDPSTILSTLVKAGKILIPKSSQKDLQILRECLHCERAEMNVVEKTMILYNWSIGLAVEEPALLVGRVYVHWDSYTHPTIYVEVDGVSLLVEFHNLVLTQSNWQAIKSRGFPPEIAVGPADPPPETASKQTDSVRLGTIDLSGKARIHIKSKPLNKDLGTLELDMDSFDDFTSIMREESEKQYKEAGRSGLTPPQVAALLQSYFTQKIRSFLLDHYTDLLDDKKEVLVEDARGLVYKAAGSILDYASDVSRKTGDEWQEKLATKLGVSRKRLDLVRESLQNLNVTTNVRSAFNNRPQDDSMTQTSGTKGYTEN